MIRNILNNPITLKLLMLGVFCIAIFLLVIVFMRRMRSSIQKEGESTRLAQGDSGFALAAYDGLARQLREQEKEIQRLREQYQQEAAMAGKLTEAVLANLSCGVLYFDRAGCLRQANRAAKSLLGYASPFSFHFRDLFRGVSKIKWPESGEEAQASSPLVQALQESLRTGAAFPRVVVEYRTPAGHQRVLGLAASVVRDKAGETAGLSCVVDDFTETTELSQRINRYENLASLGEISAGLANDFKKSLALVRTNAEALMKENSDAATRYYTENIVAELDSLAKILGEFLEFASSTKS